jgi:8-amino-3,8-dideoxy-alpha-D-manno-octulosonate transaminase
MNDKKLAVEDAPVNRERLAIDGGKPVRSDPLPLEFPGIHHMGEEELEAAMRLLKGRSPFRYYGIDLRHEVHEFKSEFAVSEPNGR